MTRTPIVLCILTATLLVGCEMPFGAGPGNGAEKPDLKLQDQVQIEPGLTARLYAPGRVAAGDSFEVRFAAENTTEGSIELQTGACWGRPAAFFGGEQVPLIGSLQICTLQLLTWTLQGEETRDRTFEMKASLNQYSGSPEEKGPAGPGTYVLRTELNWAVEGKDIKQVLEADVEVVARN